MKKTVVLLLSLLPTLLSGQLSLDQKAQLEDYINGLIKPGDPGGAVGVVKDGEVVYEHYFGLASLEHRVPVTDSSKFNIASVAKQFTALCVLKLALESKISLEDDFRKYVPGFFPDVKDTIRIRHLLNHTSGIRDFYDLLGLKGDVWWRKVGFGNKKALEFLRGQRELNFQPGSDKIYSNSNYLLLTEVVEKASGKTFHEFSKELFHAYNMSSTHFLRRYMNVIPNQAMPYSDWGSGSWQKYPTVTKLYGDGFLYTTLPDQLTFERLIQLQAEELLITSQKAIQNSEVTDYGFGLELTDKQGLRCVHHDGSTGSYHAQTLRFPDQQVSIFVMSNNNKLWSGHIANKVASILLPPIQENEVSDQLNDKKYLDNVEKSDIVGEYQSTSGQIIRIFTANDKLFWRRDNNQPLELKKIAGTLYHVAYSEKLKIGFDSNGFTVFRPDSEPKVYELMVPFKPTKNDLNDLVGTYYNEEINVQFNVCFDDDSQLQYVQKGSGDTIAFEIIQKDEFLARDYIIRPERDALEFVEGMLLTHSRLKNIRFRKVDAETSRMSRYTPDGGTISVSTTRASLGKGSGDILLTKNDTEGNEEWSRLIGGKGYDRPHQIRLAKDGGYLILGSTSSKGNGNYDAWLIKTDRKGNVDWDTTFGDEFNNYGYSLKEETDGTVSVKVTDKVPSEKSRIASIYTYWPK